MIGSFDQTKLNDLSANQGMEVGGGVGGGLNQRYYKYRYQTPIPTLLRSVTPHGDANIGAEVRI